MVKRRLPFLNHRTTRQYRKSGSRNESVTFIIVSPRGRTRSFTLTSRALTFLLSAAILLGAGAAWLITSYTHARRELGTLNAVKEVARAQAQQIEALESKYSDTLMRLQQAEETAVRIADLLRQENLVAPSSLPDPALIGQVRPQSSLTSRGGTPLAYRDMARTLAALQQQAGDVHQRVDSLQGTLSSLEESVNETVAYLRARPTGWPADGDITSGFGWRRHPVDGTLDFHLGVDIAADYWDPVRATGDGTVVFSGYRIGYGWTVVIDHGFGYRTLYAHCARLLVDEGEHVIRGQTIAYVGQSGSATGPHLHYQVQLNGEWIDPRSFLSTR